MKRRIFLKASAASLLAANVSAVHGSTSNVSAIKNKEITVRFLGTGAADWNGRDSRGELRRLSSILVDESILFDLTAGNIEMIPTECKPEAVFYTHSHKDHYDPISALQIGVKRIYLSHTWYDIAKRDFKEVAEKLKVTMPEIIPLYVGQKVQLGELAITPLPASHVTGNLFEQTLIYLMEKDKARIIYATDTAGIPAMAAQLAGIDAHNRNGKPITGLIMEATMGIGHDNDYRSFSHSSVDCVHRIVNVLQKTKRYTPSEGQFVYLTHMARTLHGTQAELDSSLPKPLKAAYDGMVVPFMGNTK
ncbi:MAG: MBL fold metallo-hydrolase [Parabacteroides sp.]|nr:MBL fold metallo-hydrolase [Parabacteroides sp.]